MKFRRVCSPELHGAAISILSNLRFSSVSIGEKNDRWLPERLRQPTRAPQSSCPYFPWASPQSQGPPAHRHSASQHWNPTAENPLAVKIHRWRFSIVRPRVSVPLQIATRPPLLPKLKLVTSVSSATAHEPSEHCL